MSTLWFTQHSVWLRQPTCSISTTQQHILFCFSRVLGHLGLECTVATCCLFVCVCVCVCVACLCMCVCVCVCVCMGLYLVLSVCACVSVCWSVCMDKNNNKTVARKDSLNELEKNILSLSFTHTHTHIHTHTHVNTSANTSVPVSSAQHTLRSLLMLKTPCPPCHKRWCRVWQ